MKSIKYLGLLLILFLLTNCKKNEDTTMVLPDVIDTPVPNPDPENQAPGNFALLEVADVETNVNLRPSFSWNTATDPDGDTVKYDLFLFKTGMDVLPDDKVGVDLNTTFFQIENSISLSTDYDWHVIAKDNKGKETSSDTYSFTTRNLNVPETADNPAADFSPRMQHTVTFFNDKLWLIGGKNKDEIKQDVFHSSNGIDWTKASGELPAARTGHATIVFNDTLWAMGGRAFPTAFTRRNQLYGTVDGVNFINGYNAPWSKRELHTTVVFKNKVWVLGGIDNDDQPLNDVWSTDEVKTWDPNSKETANWDGRYGHATVVFDDKLWVIGGHNGTTWLNEVWYTDGTSLSDGSLRWEFVPQENGFPARMSHQTVVYDDKIWLLGGYDQGSINDTKNDIWYTEDGANWLPLTQNTPFDGRLRPTLTVFENQLLMIGGQDASDYYNDVWVFD